MKIEEFINLDEQTQIEYDFVKDSLESTYNTLQQSINKNRYKSKMEMYFDSDLIFDKYIFYKKNSNLDPDRYSELLQEIYKICWPQYINSEYMSENDNRNRYCSDTLTSAQTRLNDNLNLFKEKEQYKFLNDILKQYNAKSFYSESIQKAYNNSKFKDFLNNDDRNIKLREFIDRYHTLGNYMPVPKEFNISRSGFGKYDYVDLMLIKIKEYYEKYQNRSSDMPTSLLDLLHCKDKIDYCCKWLDSYGNGIEGWKEFVKNNYFKGNFVDDNYEIVLLFEGHSWNSPKISDGMYETFYDNTTNLIEKRSKLILNVLKEKL